MMIVVLLCRWCKKGRACRGYADDFGAIGMRGLAGSSWQRVFSGMLVSEADLSNPIGWIAVGERPKYLEKSLPDNNSRGG
jgi:hypothetical protein